MKHSITLTTCLAAMLLAGGAFPGAARAEEPSRLKKLEVLTGGYPRAFFFRLSEDLARGNRLSYEEVKDPVTLGSRDGLFLVRAE